MHFRKPKSYRQWKGLDPPEITFNLQTVVVEVNARQIRAQWTVEFTQDLAAYHNINAEGELTAIVSTEMANAVDQEIIRELVRITEINYYVIHPNLRLTKPRPFVLHNEEFTIINL